MLLWFRLGSDPSLGILNCAFCQTNMTMNVGFPLVSGFVFSLTNRTLQGPFLCMSCKAKEDAMEGKKGKDLRLEL